MLQSSRHRIISSSQHAMTETQMMQGGMHLGLVRACPQPCPQARCSLTGRVRLHALQRGCRSFAALSSTTGWRLHSTQVVLTSSHPLWRMAMLKRTCRAHSLGLRRQQKHNQAVLELTLGSSYLTPFLVSQLLPLPSGRFSALA